jgi:hypothetical protein
MAAQQHSAAPAQDHRQYRRHTIRTVTELEYPDLMDCCCHKLGGRRPHLPCECRDIS